MGIFILLIKIIILLFLNLIP